jgi:ActR/RegA family two-component response regulator
VRSSASCRSSILDEPACVTPTLARAGWEHIQRVLLDGNGNGNVSEAARRLGILRQSLQRRLRKHAPPPE